MFKFAGITGYDQLEITSQAKRSTVVENSKWTKNKREVFQSSADIPKIQVTQRHVYAVHENSVVILDTKPLTDSSYDILSANRKEYAIDNHPSPITCFAVEEESLLLCSCCEENVLLSKWDSMLGHWDTKVISEGDKKILSCSVTFKGLVIYITLFKWDTLIVYKVTSAHSPKEPGPLILTNMECLATLEKVKEMTTWSKSLFFKNNFHIIGVASGNTVSVKIWEVLPEKDQYSIKLKSHRMVSYLKAIAGADVSIENDCVIVLIVGNDGSSEIYSLTSDAFVILYRFKVEDPGDSSLSASSLNTTQTIQVESRVLCAQLFPVKMSNPKPQQPDIVPEIGGDGDAKFDVEEYEKLPEKEKNALIGQQFNGMHTEMNMCPKLIVAATTTKGLLLVDVVSGQCEIVVTHGMLLNDETIFIQNAQMSVNAGTREIVLGLQSCLTRFVFSRRFLVDFNQPSSQDMPQLSLIPREALSAKSVLRKKIKSPPRQHNNTYPLKGQRSSGRLQINTGNSPSWVRSRSRPTIKSSNSKSKICVPNSARSHTSVSSDSSCAFSVSSGDNESLPKIPARGSYENDELPFYEVQKVVMPSAISNGISVLRIAATTSGKHLAFGANLSPLIITKTRPFQNYRLFKDIGKVSSLHFNFNGDLLLVASSDCRTTLVSWQNYRELLSFEFSSKFNEHVHAQFYFMDKFLVQPEENKLVLYSYAKRDNGFIKLKAGEYQLECQNITALAAANQFYSNMIITGLSNKSIQIFDTNAETVSVTIPNTHMKPISCIRLNEAPKGPMATQLCDVFLTSSFSNLDPIKLWDTRIAKCIMRISDVSQAGFVPTARPGLSPCGRYIVSGFEDGSLTFYDVRQVKHRLCTFKKIGSTVLDCYFDPNHPMVWAGCRNGSILNFHLP